MSLEKYKPKTWFEWISVSFLLTIVMSLILIFIGAVFSIEIVRQIGILILCMESSVFFSCASIEGIQTGKVNVRYGHYSREKNPTSFWLTIIAGFVISAAMISVTLFFLQHYFL